MYDLLITLADCRKLFDKLAISWWLFGIIYFLKKLIENAALSSLLNFSILELQKVYYLPTNNGQISQNWLIGWLFTKQGRRLLYTCLIALYFICRIHLILFLVKYIGNIYSCYNTKGASREVSKCIERRSGVCCKELLVITNFLKHKTTEQRFMIKFNYATFVKEYKPRKFPQLLICLRSIEM